MLDRILKTCYACRLQSRNDRFTKEKTVKYILMLVLIFSGLFLHTCLLDEPAHALVLDVDTDTVLRNQLAVVLASHPETQVREDFFQKIASGAIVITWTGGNHNAQFGLLPPEEFRKNGITHAGNRPIPFLAIKPNLLRGTQITMRAVLVIFHEYIHYLQWSQGRWPEGLFLHRPISEVEDPKEWCEQKWYAEVEAYQKECKLAHRIGGLKTAAICTPVGELDRKRLKATMTNHEANATTCLEVWKNL